MTSMRWQGKCFSQDKPEEKLAEIALKPETFKEVEQVEEARKSERERGWEKETDFSIYIIDKRSDDDDVLGNKVYGITSEATRNR